MEKVSLTPFLAATVVAVAGCASKAPVREPAAFDARFAQAVNATATEAAVTKPGTKVCRRMQVGIAESDWLRGTVSAVGDGKLTVKIADAGRFPEELHGAPLTPGAVVQDDPKAWVPCAY